MCFAYEINFTRVSYSNVNLNEIKADELEGPVDNVCFVICMIENKCK